MPRRLDKAQSRQCWAELRDIWNEFDPIGVMSLPDWPRNEYESYCGPSMRLLEQNASDEEFEAYVRSALDYMGCSAGDHNVKYFIRKMKVWFPNKWPETRVAFVHRT